MRAVILVALLSACSTEGPTGSPEGEDRPGGVEAPQDGFFTRGTLHGGGDVHGFSLHGRGALGVVSVGDMTCQFGTSTGGTTTDEDVVEGPGEVVVDSVSGPPSTALLQSGDRLLRAEAGFARWGTTDLDIDGVISARLVSDGLVALREIPEGCAVDFWRWTEDGAEAYGGAYVDACEAGLLAVDAQSNVAWVLESGLVTEVTAEGAHPLGIAADRVAWDGGADALYTSSGSVLSAWERDGTARWSVEGAPVHALVALASEGMAITRVAEDRHGLLIAYDGLTGAPLHEVQVRRAEGAMVAAPEGPVVAIQESATEIVSFDLR